MSISTNNIDKRQQPYAIAIFSIGLIMICAGATIPFLIHLQILTLSVNVTNATIAAVMLLLGVTMSALYALNRPLSDIQTAVDQALKNDDIPMAMDHLSKSAKAPTEALIKALRELDGENASTTLARTLLGEQSDVLLLSEKNALWTALYNQSMPEEFISTLLDRPDIDAAPGDNEAGNSRLVMLSKKQYANKQTLQYKLIQHNNFKQEPTPSNLYDPPELHALARPNSGLSSALFAEYLKHVTPERLSTKDSNVFAIENIFSVPCYKSEIDTKIQVTLERYGCFRQHPGFTTEMQAACREKIKETPGSYCTAFLEALAPEEPNELEKALADRREKSDKSSHITCSQPDGRHRNAIGYTPVSCSTTGNQKL